MRNKIGSLGGGHTSLPSGQFPVKQSSSSAPSLSQLSNSAAMAYSGLYAHAHHFPPHPGSPGVASNNNNTSAAAPANSCSPGAKSEPGSEAAGGGGPSHSPSCYKWSGAATPTQPAQSDNGRGGGVADILSPFQSYDQHHQVTGEYSGQNVMPSF